MSQVFESWWTQNQQRITGIKEANITAFNFKRISLYTWNSAIANAGIALRAWAVDHPEAISRDLVATLTEMLDKELGRT